MNTYQNNNVEILSDDLLKSVNKVIGNLVVEYWVINSEFDGLGK